MYAPLDYKAKAFSLRCAGVNENRHEQSIAAGCLCAPRVRRRAEQGQKAEQADLGSFKSELMTACVHVCEGGGRNQLVNE